MNANELADQLESKFIRGSHKQKAADMLRQQQAEIEALKDKLHLAKQSLDIVHGWIGKALEK
jgi:hypothetical protein